MMAASTTTTPSDLLGKALDYAYKLWPRMRNYALDGRYHIDNNDVERGQRPSVLGRKNYLFSQDDRGAEDNAVFYSLLGSCDVVQLNPLDWLTDVLGKLNDDMDEEQIIQLRNHSISAVFPISCKLPTFAENLQHYVQSQ